MCAGGWLSVPRYGWGGETWAPLHSCMQMDDCPSPDGKGEDEAALCTLVHTETWGLALPPPGRFPMILLYSVFYVNLPSQFIVNQGSLWRAVRGTIGISGSNTGYCSKTS